MRQHLFEAALESNVANAYGPVRKLISDRFAKAKGLPPEVERQCRTLLYSAADAVARRQPKLLPRYLFSWINPDS